MRCERPHIAAHAARLTLPPTLAWPGPGSGARRAVRRGADVISARSVRGQCEVSARSVRGQCQVSPCNSCGSRPVLGPAAGGRGARPPGRRSRGKGWTSRSPPPPSSTSPRPEACGGADNVGRGRSGRLSARTVSADKAGGIDATGLSLRLPTCLPAIGRPISRSICVPDLLLGEDALVQLQHGGVEVSVDCDLLLGLGVRYRKARANGHLPIVCDRPEQRANHTILLLLASAVMINDAEQHSRVHGARDVIGLMQRCLVCEPHPGTLEHVDGALGGGGDGEAGSPDTGGVLNRRIFVSLGNGRGEIESIWFQPKEKYFGFLFGSSSCLVGSSSLVSLSLSFWFFLFIFLFFLVLLFLFCF